MTLLLSPEQAGRIRDAVRLVRYGGFVAFLALLLSFVAEPAIYGFALGPIAFAFLAAATYPLLRPAGSGYAMAVAGLGLGAAIVEAIGVIAPTSTGSHLRVSSIFGAGTIGIGAWFVGFAALSRDAVTIPLEITAKLMRGGLGFALIGAGWFIEDPTMSLAAIGGGLLLANGVNPLFKYLRRYGLPDEPVAAPKAVEAAPSEIAAG
ncbi:MAG TPA: hypothetical protein VJ850_05325 [Candidatus Limnocylindrales bacterium]|nr:hypothetical protein [Candidatus Limnocylindrales bacterium]